MYTTTCFWRSWPCKWICCCCFVFVHCATMAFNEIQIIPCKFGPVARARAEFSELIPVSPERGCQGEKGARSATLQAEIPAWSKLLWGIDGDSFPIESGSNEDLDLGLFENRVPQFQWIIIFCSFKIVIYGYSDTTIGCLKRPRALMIGPASPQVQLLNWLGEYGSKVSAKMIQNWLLTPKNNWLVV